MQQISCRFSQLSILVILYKGVIYIFPYIYITSDYSLAKSVINLLQLIYHLGPSNLSNFLLDSISLFMLSSFSFFLYSFSSSAVILLIISFSFRFFFQSFLSFSFSFVFFLSLKTIHMYVCPIYLERNLIFSSNSKLLLQRSNNL